MADTANEIGASLVASYNACFTNRDITALRNMYVESGPFVYFDNHSGCDSTDLEDHLAKVQNFFETGKVGGLDVVVLDCHRHENTLSIAGLLRYKCLALEPLIRMSAFAEYDGSDWRIRHLHYSAQPG